MKRQLPLLILAGCLIGTLWTFSSGTVFILFLVAVLSLLFFIGVASSEKRFVVALFIGGFAVRALLSLALDVGIWSMSRGSAFSVIPDAVTGIPVAFDGSRSFVRLGDSDYYSKRSYGISRYAHGARDIHAMGSRFQHYGRHGYLFVTAFFYYLFGFSPVAGKLLACFFGALLGPLVYFLGKGCFNPPVGRWAALASAFFPSLIFWSTTHLKDAAVVTLGVLLLVLFARWQQARGFSQRLPWLVLFCGAFWAHVAIRSETYSLALLACLGLMGFLTWRPRKPIRLVAIGIASAALFVMRHQIQKGIAYALFIHLGHARTFPGLPYFYLPEDFYLDKRSLWSSMIGWNVPFVLGIFRAILHYLLEPLPWRPGSPMRVSSIPQMAFWMVALIFSVYGVWAVFRGKRWQALPLVWVTAVWTLMGAVTNGNVGTVFRMRDMVTPFYLILASAGFWFLIQRNLPKRSTL